ncbi:MAG: ABC transporter permease subunit [Anaerolineae bacterium]|nr:ABC transporter permease subunit [Anaerolineae bacterium]NIN94730.1 ABC transporter permease subunit [Anaerolineae bacterium]NIQ77812.1 ABC transporter permease subunit [Anaerolineae bacterium]
MASAAQQVRDFLRLLRTHRMLAAGMLILIVVILAATVGVVFVPFHPLEVAPEIKLQPPSLANPMGTDNYGRDILVRVLYGIRLDLRIAFMVAFTALVVGTLVGTFSGYYGGRVDDVVMRITDVMMAFPSFVLAMAITAMLGNTIPNVIIAIAISYMPFFIRLTRGEVLSARELGYAEAARCVGNPEWRIMYLHLLPNCLTPALVQATLCLGWAVLDAAGLAFLGLGIRPPTPELGVLVGEGALFIISGEWWTSVFPGAVIVLIAFGFNLIGDSLRDITAQEER